MAESQNPAPEELRKFLNLISAANRALQRNEYAHDSFKQIVEIGIQRAKDIAAQFRQGVPEIIKGQTLARVLQGSESWSERCTGWPPDLGDTLIRAYQAAAAVLRYGAGTHPRGQFLVACENLLNADRELWDILGLSEPKSPQAILSAGDHLTIAKAALDGRVVEKLEVNPPQPQNQGSYFGGAYWGHKRSSASAGESQSKVELLERNKAKVKGVIKQLTAKRYDLIKALIEARPKGGLTKDSIEKIWPSAREMLKHLRHDSDWEQVIHMAEAPGGRYRID